MFRLWIKDNIRFEGQNNPDVLETTIRLKTINESTGLRKFYDQEKISSIFYFQAFIVAWSGSDRSKESV